MNKHFLASRSIVPLFLSFVISVACASVALAEKTTPETHDPDVAEELRIRDGLPHFFKKLKSNETVRVGYIGGSITEQNGWRSKTFAWLEAQYPGANLIQINAAISGTGADFGACRASRDLLVHQPDMVFVEYRVNGGGGFEARAIEGLIRQIWQANPETDICLIYTISHWMLDDLKNGRQFWFGKVMETIANKYGIPSIELGVEVVKQLNAGQLIFQGEEPVEGKLVFTGDGVHPTQDGYQLYCDIVARSLDIMRDRGQPRTHTLPAPIEEKHFANASLLPVSNAILSSNWKQVNPATDDIYTRDRKRSNDMLNGAVKSDTEGDVLTIDWEGVLICFTTIPQGEAMSIELATDGGAPKLITFKQDSDENLYAQFFYAPEQEAGPHTTTLRVKTLPEGTSFYCGQFMEIAAPKE